MVKNIAMCVCQLQGKIDTHTYVCPLPQSPLQTKALHFTLLYKVAVKWMLAPHNGKADN